MWHCMHFDELTTEQLYAILRVRSQVFVVEQNCVYQDADDKDQRSHHLFYKADNIVEAYCRLLPPGLSYLHEASIGRVLTHTDARKKRLGREMMARAIATLKDMHPGVPIRIGAQKYLTTFYSSFGFKADGADYLEDGIVHIEMLLA